MHNIEDLHELCETISREIGEANEKIRKAGGKLSAGDVDYIDKLSHTLKSLNYNYGGSYRRGRDSMGRYTSRRGYSYDDGMIEELRSLMESAPDERTKSEFRQFIAKMEKM